jgi:hypothetical protein
VCSLDGEPIGAGAPFPVVERLRAAYVELTKTRGVPF